MRRQASVAVLYWYVVAEMPFVLAVLAIFVWPHSWLLGRSEVAVATCAILAQVVVGGVVRRWTAAAAASPRDRALITLYLAIGATEVVPFLTIYIGAYLLRQAGLLLAAVVAVTLVLQIVATLPFAGRITQSEPSGTAPPS